MSATAAEPVSSTAPADAGVAARAAFVKIMERCGTHKVDPALYTFCSCCGSQVVRNDGQMLSSSIPGTWTGPDRASVEEALRKKYGQNVVDRWGGPILFEASMKKMVRQGAPGVTFSFMSKEDTIKLLYPDPKDAELAGGYDFNPESTYGVCSVVWVNK